MDSRADNNITAHTSNTCWTLSANTEFRSDLVTDVNSCSILWPESDRTTWMELLAHISAPCSRGQDGRYREQAANYECFEAHTRQSLTDQPSHHGMMLPPALPPSIRKSQQLLSDNFDSSTFLDDTQLAVAALESQIITSSLREAVLHGNSTTDSALSHSLGDDQPDFRSALQSTPAVTRRFVNPSPTRSSPEPTRSSGSASLPIAAVAPSPGKPKDSSTWSDDNLPTELPSTYDISDEPSGSRLGSQTRDFVLGKQLSQPVYTDQVLISPQWMTPITSRQIAHPARQSRANDVAGQAITSPWRTTPATPGASTQPAPQARRSTDVERPVKIPRLDGPSDDRTDAYEQDESTLTRRLGKQPQMKSSPILSVPITSASRSAVPPTKRRTSPNPAPRPAAPPRPAPLATAPPSTNVQPTSNPPLPSPSSPPSFQLPPPPTDALPQSSSPPPPSSQPQPPKQPLILRPPLPPTSLLPFDPSSLITPTLSNLLLDPHLADRYHPRHIARPLRPTERGHWLFHPEATHWSPKAQWEMWDFLSRLVGSGYTGWGVWAVRSPPSTTTTTTDGAGAEGEGRDEKDRRGTEGREGEEEEEEQGLGEVRVFCWGEVVQHVYLMLYVASKNRIRKAGPRWCDARGEVVVTM
ncbi:hypothetical protein K461DRAFT_316666 [Myriangium duriaei CBS 260.36]|uniref:Uncharacterized protein n=1 Tax=Myriangium duriaei CBS 260.36 TaxID=1168546 RepID=A0A9P4IQE4_9PEZI|nr:hypothetical protein K461DRAFT_316666 [Myriangium duriaei CBS 260.36]